MIRHPKRPQAAARCPGFEEEFAYTLEEEDGAVGGLSHRLSPVSSMSITMDRFLPDRMAWVLSCSARTGLRNERVIVDI